MIADWLQTYANENDLAAVEAAVAEAEKRTAGEIVPMIVRGSMMTGHVTVIGTLVLFALSMIVIPFISYRLPGPEWAYDLAAVILSVLLGWLLSRLSEVRRFFTSVHDQELSVLNRAQLEFYQTGIPHTEGRTGVLIFVSLQERRAVILGDQSIAAKLDDKTWVGIIEGLLTHMKGHNLRGGFVEAIGKVGDILEREFPIQPGDRNELPNSLVIKV